MSADVLSDVLRSLRLTGTVYFCDQLETPWNKNFADPNAASFHQVRRGGCWLTTPQQQVYLGPGDLLFVSPGVEHQLSSNSNDPAATTVAPPTLLLCGYCEFTAEADSPMRTLFPSVSIMRQADIDQNPWLRVILDRLATEYLSAQPGSAAIVAKLTEIVIVELIRENFGSNQSSGLLGAIRDKQMSKALQRLHASPATGWTLDSLAKDVGMSRAALARRFKTLVGLPMLDYLTRLRIQRAQELLANSALPMHEVASQVGYQSEVSFTKVFKKRTGTTPVRYRKEQLS